MMDQSRAALLLDIDGTLTRPTGEGIDPRVFDPIRNWNAPVVLATAKAFPFPVSLAHFIGVPELIVAENSGVIYAENETVIQSNRVTKNNHLTNIKIGDTVWISA